jgi:hypothetical protein
VRLTDGVGRNKAQQDRQEPEQANSGSDGEQA